MSNKPAVGLNVFSSQTGTIPLSYLDTNFNAITTVINDLISYSNYGADLGSANSYIAAFSSASINTSVLTAGLRVQFKAANANTTASTLSISINGVSIGNAPIKLTDGSALSANTILAGAIVDCLFDGTNFQLMNDASGGSLNLTNLSLSGNLTVTGTSAFTGNVTTTNSVGIGGSAVGKLDVIGSAGSVRVGLTGDIITFTKNGVNTINSAGAAASLALQTNSVNAITFDVNGNAVMGSPSVAVASGRYLEIIGTNNSTPSILSAVTSDGSRWISFYSGLTVSDNPSVTYSGDLRFGTSTDPGAAGYTERMRLSSTGLLSITNGTTLSGGNLTFSTTSQRILGDFSNATLLSRTMFQTSTTNGATGVYFLPNGTSTASSIQVTNAADPTNASKILIATNGTTDVQLVSGINGTGTYLPMTFYNSGAEKMRLDTAGNFYVETGNFWQYSPAPPVLSSATTLTAAQLQGGIIITAGSTAYNVTLPTATVIDAGFPGIGLSNVAFDFFIVSTATVTVTVVVNTGINSSGVLTISSLTSAHFKLRRTGAAAYVLYRVS